ncbi:MAG TPA: hypothetical protein PLQ04_03390 [Lachnospiraceae bacterium]|nr:hypothetical protein [Lachnospiraceae bacterium]
MTAGKATYSLNGVEIGSVDIIFMESVEEAKVTDCFLKILRKYLL